MGARSRLVGEFLYMDLPVDLQVVLKNNKSVLPIFISNSDGRYCDTEV